MIKEKLTRSTAQIMRGHSGKGLGSVGSSNKPIDMLEEPVSNMGGIVGVDREEHIPYGPPMLAHLGTPSFDGLDVWVVGKPKGLDPGPGKMLKSGEKDGPKMGLGCSGLRPESMEALSYDGVDAKDLNIPIIDDSLRDRALIPNVSDVDVMEKRYEDQATDNGEKSLTSPPSYFCCDLILGNSSGIGGSYGFEFIKNQRPLQMVTVDGREWGLIVSPGGRQDSRRGSLSLIC